MIFFSPNAAIVRNVFFLVVFIHGIAAFTASADEASESNATTKISTYTIYFVGGSVKLARDVVIEEPILQYRDQSDGVLYRIPLEMVERVERNQHDETLQADSAIVESPYIERITEPQQSSEPRLTTTKNDDKPDTTPFIQRYLRKSIYVGPTLAYMHYRERVPPGDLLEMYQRSYGVPPDTIIGEPKSTEYGPLGGVTFSMTKKFGSKPIVLKPSFMLTVGDNTYDGSSQAQPVQDSNSTITGVRFDPVKQSKFNLFFEGGAQIGYCSSGNPVHFLLGSGLNALVWWRDLTPEHPPTGYSVSEIYFAFYIPLWGSFFVPLNSRLILGVELAADCMFYGGMQVLESYPAYTGYKVKYPLVTLGNQMRYRLEIPFLIRLKDKIALRITPYGMIYAFEKSNTATATLYQSNYPLDQKQFYEPASSTVRYGLAANVVFLLDGNQN